MAYITKMTEDIAYVSKLGDYPKVDNGLDADELKAWFDKAPLAIQKYLNSTLLPALENKLKDIDDWQDLTDQKIGGFVTGTGFLDVAGVTPMIANLNMNNHKVINVSDPTSDKDAVPFGYADNRYFKKSGGSMTGELQMSGYPVSGLNTPTSDSHAANKAYVDSRFSSATATLLADNWRNNLQSVSVSGVTSSADVIVSGEASDSNWEAYTGSGIRAVYQGNGTLQFKCDSVPAINVTINVLVRRGS